jgi:CBS domain-containing protein
MICPGCGFENLQGIDECERCGTDLRSVDIPGPGDALEERLVSDRLDGVGRREPVMVPAAASLRAAIAALQEARASCLLVGDGGRLDGVVTAHDLLVRTAGRSIDGLVVGDVMTPDPVVLQADDTVAVAIHVMAAGGFRDVPIVEEGRAIGVVTSQDLLRHVLGILGQPEAVPDSSAPSPVREGPPSVVLVLADDLIWGSRLVEAVRRAGAVPVRLATERELAIALEAATLAEPGAGGDANAAPAPVGAVVDLFARRYEGATAIRRIAEAHLPVIAVAEHDDLAARKRALDAGAKRVFSYAKFFSEGPRLVAEWLAAGEGP